MYQHLYHQIIGVWNEARLGNKHFICYLNTLHLFGETLERPANLSQILVVCRNIALQGRQSLLHLTHDPNETVQGLVHSGVCMTLC